LLESVSNYRSRWMVISLAIARQNPAYRATLLQLFRRLRNQFLADFNLASAQELILSAQLYFSLRNRVLRMMSGSPNSGTKGVSITPIGRRMNPITRFLDTATLNFIVLH